jgi:hypothetical protein
MNDYTGGEDGYSPLMGASRTPYDVNSTPRHEVLNFEGTPTQFSDDSGLKALLTRQGIFDINSFNPIYKEGEKITADTARQATNEEGQLLFLDADGNQTTRPTGVPAIGGTVGDAAYMKKPRSGGGVFGDIGADFRDMVKDPMFHKFLLTAAAIGTGGLAANAAFGVGGLGAAGGASGAGGALGTIGGDIGAFTAADMAASAAAGEGALGAGSLTAGITPEMVAAYEAALPQTMADIGGLSGTAGSIGMTDAEAAALMENNLLPADMQTPATADIGAKDVLRNANRLRQLSNLANGAVGSGAGGIPDVSSFGSGVLPTAGAAATTGALSKLSPETLYTGTPTEKPFEIKKVEAFHPQASQIDTKVLTDIINGGAKSNEGYGVAQSYPVPNPSPLPSYSLDSSGDIMGFAMGGGVDDDSWMHKHPTHVAEFKTGTTGHHVQGAGDGQSDDIPAMLADGEYVFDSDTVAALGNGSNKAGAGVLDKFREALREHKRSAPTDKIPPKAAPLTYLKQALKD